MIHRQVAPKTAKNGKLYSTVILKSASSEYTLLLWEDAAKWKLPLKEVTLRGKFVKNEFGGSTSLKCEEITPPDGSTQFEESEIQGEVGKVKITECLDAGLRAADWVSRKGKPEFAAAAFSFAASALLQGVKLE